MTSFNSAGFTRITVVLLTLSSALVASASHDTAEVTDRTDNQGEKRSAASLQRLTKDATHWKNERIFALQNSGYGCWCRPHGFGRTVDKVDFCCKVYQHCLESLKDINQTCTVTLSYAYSLQPSACDAVANYPPNDNLAKCKHALCLCDVEWARCIGHYKNRYKKKYLGYDQGKCIVTDRTTSKSSADVIILTQDNRHISAATLSKIKNITKSLVRRLDQSSNITLRYAWGTYASRSGVSDFVSKTAVTSLVDNYTHGSSGKVNFLKGALDRVKIKLSNITGNQAKVVVILTDGNSEYITNSSMDTYVLETSAARVRRRAKIVGLLVPNKQGTQRIAKLMSIVTGPNDAIDPANFARTTADNIAKLIAFRVKRWIKPVLYTVALEVGTSNAGATYNFSVLIKLEGTNGEKTGVHQLYKPSKSLVSSEGTIVTHEFVIEDGDIVTTNKIWMNCSPAKSNSPNFWELRKVTVTKGSKTVKAFINKTFGGSGDWEEETAQIVPSSSG